MLDNIRQLAREIVCTVTERCPRCCGPLSYLEFPEGWKPKYLAKPPHFAGRRIHVCPACQPITEGNMVAFSKKTGVPYHRRS